MISVKSFLSLAAVSLFATALSGCANTPDGPPDSGDAAVYTVGGISTKRRNPEDSMRALSDPASFWNKRITSRTKVTPEVVKCLLRDGSYFEISRGYKTFDGPRSYYSSDGSEIYQVEAFNSSGRDEGVFWESKAYVVKVFLNGDSGLLPQ